LPSGINGLCAGNGHGADLTRDWHPRKASVGAHDGVDLPSTDDFADPIGACPKDGKIPQRAGGEGVLDIKIRRPVFVLRPRRIGLIGLPAGPSLESWSMLLL